MFLKRRLRGDPSPEGILRKWFGVDSKTHEWMFMDP